MAEAKIQDRAAYIVKKAFRSLLKEELPGHLLERGMREPTIERQQELLDGMSINDLFPYRSYSEEEGLYVNTDSLGFVLYANPTMGLGMKELGVLDGLLAQEHPANTVVQMSIIADPNVEPLYDDWKRGRMVNEGDNKEIYKLWFEERINYLKRGKWNSFFKDQSMLTRDFHLLISYTVPVEKGSDPLEYPKGERERIVRMREAFVGNLKSAGVHAVPLVPKGLIGIVSGMLNPTDKSQPELDYNEHDFINDQITSRESALFVGRDGLSLTNNDKNISILPWSVRKFPREWAGFKNTELIGRSMDDVLRIGCPFAITTTVVIPDQLAQKGKVTSKITRATQMADSPVSKFVPQWKDRKMDWDFVKKRMDAGSKLLKMSYNITLFAESGKEQAAEQSLRSVYSSLGWTLQKDSFCGLYSLKTAFPMGIGRETRAEMEKLAYFRSLPSWNCINLSPLVGEWKGTPNKMMMMFGRRGQTFFVDPFDNTKGNYNISVAAASGAGKSFATHEYIFSTLSGGGRAFVIDSGRSYEETCKLLNGTYLEFGKDSNICVNPFSNIEDLEEGMPLVKELICQMCDSENPISPEEKSLVEQACFKAWSEKGKEATITTVRDHLQDMGDEVARKLATSLFPFTKDGMHGRYFEGISNIDFSNELVVLELDDLNSRPDLQRIVLFILIFNITQAMYMSDRKQRKICIIDEAWRLLGGNAGYFIEEGYRVARKYGGCFMTVTQGIDDYYKNPTATAAFQNSDWVWLLRQKEESLDQAKKTSRMKMDGGRLELYASLDTVKGKYSEMAFVSPDGVAVGRLIVDPFSEKLYSTDAGEVQFIRERTESGMSVVDAIRELVALSGER